MKHKFEIGELCYLSYPYSKRHHKQFCIPIRKNYFGPNATYNIYLQETAEVITVSEVDLVGEKDFAVEFTYPTNEWRYE